MLCQKQEGYQDLGIEMSHLDGRHPAWHRASLSCVSLCVDGMFQVSDKLQWNVFCRCVYHDCVVPKVEYDHEGILRRWKLPRHNSQFFFPFLVLVCQLFVKIHTLETRGCFPLNRCCHLISVCDRSTFINDLRYCCIHTSSSVSSHAVTAVAIVSITAYPVCMG